MAHCWDDYLWKAHKAIAIDPWTDHLQLLDVLVLDEDDTYSGLRGYLPSWLLPRRRAHSSRSSASFLRAGSMQSLAVRKNIDTSNSVNNESASKDANTDTKPPPSVASDGSNGVATSVVNQSTDTSSSQVDKVAVDKQLELTIISLDMPDLETTIKSSSSFLGSFAVASPTGQFDISRSRNISVNVSGVKSRRVDIDALLDLVTPRRFSLSSHSSSSTINPPAWQPDIFLPRLRWSPSKGQTLWIVVEIIHANKISVQSEKKAELKNEAEVEAVAGTQEVNASLQGSVDRSGLWRVTAPGEKSTFPLACRLQRLDYDAYGNLVCGINREMSRCHSSRHHPKPAKMQSFRVSQHCVARSFSLSR
ncbi:hypothetical protein KP509_13G031400 [Ceratopteris richardii]|uniref:Uncharacterized protein n=1 Tax=Ceratopteris richardii TaxID=49495 RepID=A0A8T2TEH0_CERRI|nr:hypothetical protein KP509_13G031400 [Ceratopteris richardii]